MVLICWNPRQRGKEQLSTQNDTARLAALPCTCAVRAVFFHSCMGFLQTWQCHGRIMSCALH
jgi:hypothetical protein